MKKNVFKIRVNLLVLRKTMKRCIEKYIYSSKLKLKKKTINFFVFTKKEY